MKKYPSLICTVLFAAFLTFSCKNSGSTGNSVPVDQGESGTVKTESDAGADVDDFMTRGEKVYKKECLACHQADGSGVPMMFPPITESEIISGENEKLILLVLNGLKGPIEIKGEQYNSIMPPMKDNLDDQEIADLLSYLRNSFGNSAGKIAPSEVAKLRE